MKMFRDPELEEEISQIDFGEVEIGQSKEVTVYLLNERDTLLKNLNFSFKNTDVEVVTSPRTLSPRQISKLTVRWTPNLQIKKALKIDLVIRGEEVILK